MFSFYRTISGITVPVGVLCVSAQTETALTSLSLQATNAVEQLLLPLSGTMTFTLDDETVYTAPFSGSDFLEIKTGTLSITIDASLDNGVHRIPLKNRRRFPGTCGFGLFGTYCPGFWGEVAVECAAILQVQAFSWQSTDETSDVIMYTVPTRTK